MNEYIERMLNAAVALERQGDYDTAARYRESARQAIRELRTGVRG